MGISNLRWLCVAFLFIPSVAFSFVDVDKLPNSTDYRFNSKTISVPPNTNISGSSIPNSIQKVTGGLTQSFKGTVSLPTASTSMSGRFVFNSAALRNAAKLAIRGSGWLALGAIGLELFLQDNGWSIGDNNVIIGTEESKDYYSSAGGDYQYYTYSGFNFGNAGAACPAIGAGSRFNSGNYSMTSATHTGSVFNNTYVTVYCDVNYVRTAPNGEVTSGTGQSVGNVQIVNKDSCPSSYPFSDINGCYRIIEKPVPLETIDEKIDEQYEAEPEDFEVLYPFLEPTEIELDPLPEIDLAPEIETITDNQTGKTTVKEKQTKYEFETKNNTTEKPSLDLKTSTRTDTYEDGQLVNSETVTVDTPSVPSENTPNPEPGTSSSELPAFCTWASIICDWLDWTQEPIDKEPDLSDILNDEDFEQNYSISFGSKTCPAPIDVHLSFIGKDIELTFDWFCELAGLIYYMVMASAYVFAAYITLGVVRNG